MEQDLLSRVAEIRGKEGTVRRPRSPYEKRAQGLRAQFTRMIGGTW